MYIWHWQHQSVSYVTAGAEGRMRFSTAARFGVLLNRVGQWKSSQILIPVHWSLRGGAGVLSLSLSCSLTHVRWPRSVSQSCDSADCPPLVTNPKTWAEQSAGGEGWKSSPSASESRSLLEGRRPCSSSPGEVHMTQHRERHFLISIWYKSFSFHVNP